MLRTVDEAVTMARGYGAEACIGGSLAGRIPDEQMLPSIRQGDIGLGVLRSVSALAQEFARRFEFDLASAADECTGT